MAILTDRFNANRFALGPVEIIGASGEFIKIDVFVNVHFTWMDLQNAGSCLFIWGRQLNFTIQSARAKQRRVEDINTIGCSDHLQIY